MKSILISSLVILVSVSSMAKTATVKITGLKAAALMGELTQAIGGSSLNSFFGRDGEVKVLAKNASGKHLLVCGVSINSNSYTGDISLIVGGCPVTDSEYFSIAGDSFRMLGGIINDAFQAQDQKLPDYVKHSGYSGFNFGRIECSQNSKGQECSVTSEVVDVPVHVAPTPSYVGCRTDGCEFRRNLQVEAVLKYLSSPHGDDACDSANSSLLKLERINEEQFAATCGTTLKNTEAIRMLEVRVDQNGKMSVVETRK